MTDAETLIANCLTEAEFPELPNFYRGKVRDTYALDDGRSVFITTDRQSAFDRVLAAVPFKGQVSIRPPGSGLTGPATFAPTT